MTIFNKHLYALGIAGKCRQIRMRFWALFFCLLSSLSWGAQEEAKPALLHKAVDDAFFSETRRYQGLGTLFTTDITAQQNVWFPNLFQSDFFFPSPGLSRNTTQFRPYTSEELYEAGKVKRDELYDSVEKKFLAKPSPWSAALEQVENLPRLLRLNTMLPERKDIPRTQAQIQIETNNRFYSKYQRGPDATTHPMDRKNWNVIETQVEQEEVRRKTTWKKEPESFENIKKRMLRELKRIRSEHYLAQLKDFLGTIEKHNKKGEQVKFSLPIGDNQFAVYGLDINSKNLKLLQVNNVTGELEYRNPLKPGAPIMVLVVGVSDGLNSSPLEWHHLDLKIKDWKRDPDHILKLPRELVADFLELAHSQKLNHDIDFHQANIEGVNNLSRLQYAVSRAAETRVQFGLRKDQFRHYAEIFLLKLHSKQDAQTNPDMLFYRLSDETKLPIDTDRIRNLWWAKVEDPKESWLDRELRARELKRPHLNDLAKWNDRYETLKRALYNPPHKAGAITKNYLVPLGVVLSAVGVLATGAVTAMDAYKGEHPTRSIRLLSNDLFNTSFKIPEKKSEFGSDYDYKALLAKEKEEREKLQKEANEKAFGSAAGTVKQAVNRMLAALKGALPAGMFEGDGAHSLTGESGAPQGSGLKSGSAGGSGKKEKNLFTVSGDTANRQLYMATSDELKRAYETSPTLSEGEDDLVLKGQLPITPSDNYISVPTPESFALNRIELRSADQKVISPIQYKIVQDQKTRTYGVHFKNKAETVILNASFKQLDSHSSNQSAIPEKAFEKEKILKEIEKLKEAGFTDIAIKIEERLKENPRMFAKDLANITADSSVYTHARVLPPNVALEDLARNPYLQYADFAESGILCGECDAGNSLLNTLLNSLYQGRDFEAKMRVSLVSKDGFVSTTGHVQNEISYTGNNRGRARMRNQVGYISPNDFYRLDATPLQEPSPELAAKLKARDELAGGHGAEGGRAPLPEPPSVPVKPLPFPSIAHQIFAAGRNERGDSRDSIEYVPPELRDKNKKALSEIEKISAPVKEAVKTIEKPVAKEIIKVEPEKLVVEKSPEDLWRERWRAPLEREMKSQEQLFKKNKLRLSQTPVLKPIVHIASQVSSYAQGFSSLEQIHKSITGIEEYPGPEMAKDRINQKLSERVDYLLQQAEKVRTNRNLASLAPELAEKALLEHFALKLPPLIKSMFRDMPAATPNCEFWFKGKRI